MSDDEFTIKLDNGTLKCTVCGKEYSNRNRKQNMQYHVGTHIDGLSYECQYCDKTFNNNYTLYQHKRNHHK